jgi:RNA polymerase sigma-70 factor (sigma-E family)
VRADREAEFEAFVALRSGELMRVALMLTGDSGHAEDLVQTALLKACRHWGRIAREDPYPYVRRTLVTSAAGWRRQRSTSEIVDLPSPEKGRDAGRPDESDRIAERDELSAALATLPPRMRAVLYLRYGEDLSEAATADALGCSIHTVKSQTARGLARLRGQLREPGAVLALEEC